MAAHITVQPAELQHVRGSRFGSLIFDQNKKGGNDSTVQYIPQNAYIMIHAYAAAYISGCVILPLQSALTVSEFVLCLYIANSFSDELRADFFCSDEK